MNKYIDFKGIFVHLMKDHEDVMEHHKYEADHYQHILDFYQRGGHDEFEIEHEECEFLNTEIVFVFGYSFNDANESDTQGSSAAHIITYDRLLEEFTNHEYEQG